jgi:hypothetical protein
MATFAFVEEGKITPITRYADIDGFMSSMNKVAELATAGHKVKANLEMIRSLRHLRLKVLAPLVSGVITEGSYEALGRLMRNVIMIGAMHFMDPYNFDLERVQRCGIHYAVPDGRIIPFCTMNSLHREKIERQFAKVLQPIAA